MEVFSCSYAEDYHQQYLSDAKNPYGYCNHGPNGLTCHLGVARTTSYFGLKKRA